MTTLIKPGIMVSLHSTVAGGVSYQRTTLDPDGNAALDAAGAAVSRWETTKVVDDPAEHQRAERARSTALKGIRRCCSRTSFGLLCPESNEADLDAAIKAARSITEDFNRTAIFTRLHVYTLKGRVASSDEEAARAIGEEVRALIASMNTSIDRLDIAGIRDAASKAKELSAVLAPEQAETVGAAIQAARKAARQIAQRVEKDGEVAAVVLADIQRGAIEKARIAFLDLDDAPAPAGPQLPSVDVQRMGALDIDAAPDSLDSRAMTDSEVAAIKAADTDGNKWIEDSVDQDGRTIPDGLDAAVAGVPDEVISVADAMAYAEEVA